MHPVIKIVSFIIFGAAVSMGNSKILLTGVSLVLPLYLFGNKAHLKGVFSMLRRLKWLFVSILVVYLFFTPGQLLWTDVLWSPTLEGIREGLLRVAVLVLIVAAVNYLLTSTEQDDFLSAVLWCLRPLSIIGLPHERLAVRITLTIDEVSQIRNGHYYEKRRNERSDSESFKSSNKSDAESKLVTIANKANQLFQSVITSAEARSSQKILLPEESAPPLYQWLIPVVITILFFVVKNGYLINF